MRFEKGLIKMLPDSVTPSYAAVKPVLGFDLGAHEKDLMRDVGFPRIRGEDLENIVTVSQRSRNSRGNTKNSEF